MHIVKGMSAPTILALLQMESAQTQHALENHGWSPFLWFWVILGAVMVAVFLALAFRRPRLPTDRELRDRDIGDPAHRYDRSDREVYP